MQKRAKSAFTSANPFSEIPSADVLSEKQGDTLADKVVREQSLIDSQSKGNTPRQVEVIDKVDKVITEMSQSNKLLESLNKRLDD